jgi:hypothetical protein
MGNVKSKLPQIGKEINTKNNTTRKEFIPIPIPSIIDLEYILENRPNPVQPQSQHQPQPQSQHQPQPQPQPQPQSLSQPQPQPLYQPEPQSNIILAIVDLILKYNNTTWRFGNISETEIHKLMNKETYENFLNYIRNIIKKSNTQAQTQAQTQIQKLEKDIPNEIKDIITQINSIGAPDVNTFFSIDLNKLFPDFRGSIDPKDFINITLLGLASIIGAEHLVIYFLMLGANPSITYADDNIDTATLMLSYQIGLVRNTDGRKKNFIVLARLLYNLYLLGSVGTGVDLSNIFNTNNKIIRKDQNNTQVNILESILHQLVSMNDIDFSKNSNKLLYLTLENGASILLLLKILEKNNILNTDKSLKLFSNINSQNLPFGYTILYSLLLNNNMDGNIKLSLVFYLINKGADPLIIPKITQNNRINQKTFSKNKTEIYILFALLQNSNKDIFQELINILSKNRDFDVLYKKIGLPILGETKKLNFEDLLKNNERLKKILEEVAKMQKLELYAAVQQSKLIGEGLNVESMKKLLESSKTPQTSLFLTSVGGTSKKINIRTFYFYGNEKYSNIEFKADRPIIAAYNAYEFLKNHNKNLQKKVIFTIYDISNNRKYKYTGKTLKDGKYVIKSYK